MIKRKSYSQLKLKISNVGEKELPDTKIMSSIDVHSLALDFWDIQSIGIYESFYALFLNRANKPIGWALISTGGVAGTVVDNKILFSHAVLALASYEAA